MAYELYVHEHSFADVAKLGTQIYFRHIGKFFIMFFILLYPILFLWSVYLDTKILKSAVEYNTLQDLYYLQMNDYGSIFFQLLFLLMQIFTVSVLTVALHDVCVGGQPSVYRSFRVVRECLPSLALTSLFELFIVAIGYIFLVVPGVILQTYYAFSISIVMVERKCGMKALKRSVSLVRGRFYKVFFLLALSYVPFYAISVLSVYTWIWLQLSNLPSMIAFDALTSITLLLFLPWPYIIIVLLYYDAVSRKEGRDIESILTDVQYDW